MLEFNPLNVFRILQVIKKARHKSLLGLGHDAPFIVVIGPFIKTSFRLRAYKSIAFIYI